MGAGSNDVYREVASEGLTTHIYNYILRRIKFGWIRLCDMMRKIWLFNIIIFMQILLSSCANFRDDSMDEEQPVIPMTLQCIPTHIEDETINYQAFLRYIWIYYGATPHGQTTFRLDKVQNGQLYGVIGAGLSFPRIYSRERDGEIRHSGANTNMTLTIDGRSATGYYSLSGREYKSPIQLVFYEEGFIRMSTTFRNDVVMRPATINDLDGFTQNDCLSFSMELNDWGYVFFSLGVFGPGRRAEFPGLYLLSDTGNLLYRFGAPYQTGTWPYALLVADKNGDGLLDVKFITTAGCNFYFYWLFYQLPCSRFIFYARRGWYNEPAYSAYEYNTLIGSRLFPPLISDTGFEMLKDIYSDIDFIAEFTHFNKEENKVYLNIFYQFVTGEITVYVRENMLGHAPAQHLFIHELILFFEPHNFIYYFLDFSGNGSPDMAIRQNSPAGNIFIVKYDAEAGQLLLWDSIVATREIIIGPQRISSSSGSVVITFALLNADGEAKTFVLFNIGGRIIDYDEIRYYFVSLPTPFENHNIPAYLLQQKIDTEIGNNLLRVSEEQFYILFEELSYARNRFRQEGFMGRIAAHGYTFNQLFNSAGIDSKNSLSSWVGMYTFNEFLQNPYGSNVTMRYKIYIYEYSGNYYANIIIDGNFSMIRDRAILKGNYSEVNLIFHSFLPDSPHINADVEMEAITLLSFMRYENEIITTWGAITAALPVNKEAGIHFKPVLFYSNNLYSSSNYRVYFIENEGRGIYLYKIINLDGAIVKKEKSYRFPSIKHFVDENLISITRAVGTNLFFVQYYDIINDRFSDVFQSPIISGYGLIVIAANYHSGLLIRNIFAPTIYKVYTLNFSPVANPFNAIINAAFLTDYKLEVTFFYSDYFVINTIVLDIVFNDLQT